MKTTPAIVLKSKFVMPSAKEYTDYVSYIDREDAKINLNINNEVEEEFSIFHSYMDYMGDDKKQGALFTSEWDTLNKNSLVTLRNLFSQAEKNGSPMWQDVISFDNEWLVEQGIYEKTTGELDEKQIKEVVRHSMNEMLDAENMRESALWTASVHYNTDNIHVHIATVEPIPTREQKNFKDKETGEWKEEYRAKRKQKSLDKMKSAVINGLLDRNFERNRINDLIRGTVKNKKENQVELARTRKTKKLFLEAIEKMPDDMRQWKYGYQSVDEARPLIDEISEIYLNTFHKKEMKELHETLNKETEVMRKLYGDKSDYKNYKHTKLDDLKKRMGNAVIAEMRNYKKNERASKNQKRKPFRTKHRRYNKYYRARGVNELNFALKRLQFALLRASRNYHQDRNMREYEKLQEEIERER